MLSPLKIGFILTVALLFHWPVYMNMLYIYISLGLYKFIVKSHLHLEVRLRWNIFFRLSMRNNACSIEKSRKIKIKPLFHYSSIRKVGTYHSSALFVPRSSVLE